MRLIDDEDFEKAARSLRTEVGIDGRFCPDLIFVLDALQRSGTLKACIRRPKDQMPDDEAYFDAFERVVYIRDDTFSALDHLSRGPRIERRRARFTMAHELAHITQGHGGIRYRGASNKVAERLVATVRRQETEAHRFAAAFLVPSHLANASMTAEFISELFDINISAARLRKQTLERMDRRARGIKRPLPRGIVDFLRQAKEKGHHITSIDDDEDEG
jgi:hypothetical protein